MSWSKSFTGIAAKELVSLAHEAAGALAGIFAERERLQMLVAAEIAVLMAGHMAAARVNVTLSGHAHASNPGPGDTISISVNHAQPLEDAADRATDHPPAEPAPEDDSA